MVSCLFADLCEGRDGRSHSGAVAVGRQTAGVSILLELGASQHGPKHSPSSAQLSQRCHRVVIVIVRDIKSCVQGLFHDSVLRC